MTVRYSLDSESAIFLKPSTVHISLSTIALVLLRRATASALSSSSSYKGSTRPRSGRWNLRSAPRELGVERTVMLGEEVEGSEDGSEIANKVVDFVSALVGQDEERLLVSGTINL